MRTRILALILCAVAAPGVMVGMGCDRSGTTERTAGGFGPPGSTSNKSPIAYLSGGDGGTLTIGAGRYVSTLWCIGSGTISITPSGPNEKLPCTGPGSDAGEQLLDGGWQFKDGGGDAGFRWLDGGSCAPPGAPAPLSTVAPYTLNVGMGIQASPTGLADGTRIVFSAGTKYLVTTNAYGPQ